MDNNTVLKITHDGQPFVDGKPPIPRSSTISMINDAPQGNVVTQEQVLRARNERTVQQGRFAWSKLHSYRGCDPQWLDIWQYLIPARCDCKDGYQKIIEEYPPDFSSPDAFFAWGVALHNAVNRKLGKPELTIEEARKIWRLANVLEPEKDQS